MSQLLSKLLIGLKCAFFIVACAGQIGIYYKWKALGFKILGALSLYERKHFAFLDKTLPNPLSAVDIGAHLGIYTRFFARRAGESGKVMAFEPFPTCYDYLIGAFKDNNQVAIKPFAISDQSGAKFYLNVPKLCGLVPEAALAYVSDAPTPSSVEITTKKLDDFIGEFERLDIIKADIEGHELKFFQGAQGIIKKFRPLILFEDNAIERNLPTFRALEREFGYKLSQLSERLTLEPYSGDFSADYNYYFVPF